MGRVTPNRSAISDGTRHGSSAANSVRSRPKRPDESPYRPGLVTGEQVPSAQGPNRKVYRRTPKGEAALERWLAEPPELSRPRHAFLAQLYMLGERKDPARTRVFLQDLRSLFLRTLSHYRQLEAQWFSASDSLPDDLFHGFVTLRFGLMRMEASVAWCDETLQRLDARAGARRSEDD